MMKLLRSFWRFIDGIGLRDNENDTIYKEIVFLNRFVSLAILAILFYIPLEIAVYGWAMIPSIVSYLLLSLVALLLVTMKRYTAARIYYLILANVTIAYLVIQCGGTLNNEYLFFPVSLLGLPLFRNYKPFVYGNFALSVVLFISSVKLAPLIGPFVEISEQAATDISFNTNILAFAFLFALLASFRKTSLTYINALKQKSDIIEEKNAELGLSLDYARRLQLALTPMPTVIKSNCINQFCIHNPKDKVSGDFPFYHEKKDGSIWVAAADCTGHGVPGGIISVVCMSVLSEAMRLETLNSPAVVLDYVSNSVESRLNLNKVDQVLDGMDISLVKIQKKKYEYYLEWAGANNPLWLVSTTELKDDQGKLIKKANSLFEWKGDNRPVGKYYSKKPFSHYSMIVPSGTKMYMFSDGYADQFGGHRNKKILKKRFAEQLLTENKDLEAIESHLQQYFLDWKSDNEQVDDVLVIGLELKEDSSQGN